MLEWLVSRLGEVLAAEPGVGWTKTWLEVLKRQAEKGFRPGTDKFPCVTPEVGLRRVRQHNCPGQVSRKSKCMLLRELTGGLRRPGEHEDGGTHGAFIPRHWSSAARGRVLQLLFPAGP